MTLATTLAMTLAVSFPDRRGPGGAALLWGSAGAAALAAHAVLAAWMLREPPVSASPAAPAAVMIEFAPEPVAPRAAETAIAPDVVDQQEVLEAPDRVPEPLRPLADLADLTDLAPPPDLAPPLEDVLPEVALTPVAVADVAVSRPKARPERTGPPEPAVAPEPVRTVKKEREPPAPQRTEARADAPPAPKAAAAQNSRGASGSMSAATWKSRMMARLEQAKRYPRGAQRRREEGVAYVSFAMDGDGRVLAAQLARSSGHAELDREVLALVRRASPLPPPPPGVPGTITAPVRFRMR